MLPAVASNHSIGVASDSADDTAAVVQVGAVSTFGRHGRGGGWTVAVSRARALNAEWYGQAPELLYVTRTFEPFARRFPELVQVKAL